MGSLLEVPSSLSASKGDAATVGAANQNNVRGSTEKGEIYIRADGKKVRKVKKVVSSANDDDTVTSEVYIRADGKKVRRVVRARSSASVTGNPNNYNESSPTNSSTASGSLGGFLNATPSSNNYHNSQRRSGPATVTGAETYEGEIIIRPDGRKVRRIKKTVVKQNTPLSGSATSDLPRTETSTKYTAISSSGNSSNNNQLAGFLNSNAETTPKRYGASATISVGGESELGEIYINKDGKKVRRVKRGVGRNGSEITAASTLAPLGGFLDRPGAAESEVYINQDGKKVRRVKKVSGSASVSPDMMMPKAKSIAEGEIYIRADGKKVRRVKRNNSSLSTSSSVAVNSITKLEPSETGDHHAKSLEGFLGNQSHNKFPITGSATVAGERVSTKIDGGEIYINADGKKVRRVRKQRSTTSATASAATTTFNFGLAQSILKERATKSQANSSSPPQENTPLHDQLSPLEVAVALPVEQIEESLPTPIKTSNSVESIDSGLDTSTQRSNDSAGASDGGGTSAAGHKPQEGEIYIRPDGKKVRRVRRSQSNMGMTTSLGGFLQKDADTTQSSLSGSATVVGDRKLDGEIVIRPDGKKVIRRIKSKQVGSSSASLSGDSSSLGGEVYRNADGKLVRRVKRSPSTASVAQTTEAVPSVTSLNSNPATPKGPTTVSASDVTKEPSPLQALVRKPSPWAMSKDESQPSGATTELSASKPVSPPSSLEKSKPVTLLTRDEEAIAASFRTMKKLGLPDDAVRHKMTGSEIDPKIIAAVMGDEWSDADACREESETKACSSTPVEREPTLKTPNSSIRLTDEEEAVAAVYRKMQKMGLPDDAVRHKMTMSEVDPKVIAVIMGEEWVEEPSRQAASATWAPLATPTSKTPVQLTGGEEAIASIYRKMLMMGLPDDAVRHKMIVSDVHPKIMAAVLGEDWVDDATVEPPATLSAALTNEEEVIVAQYRKMQKMGLPDDAVRHKMIVSEVHPKVIAAVLGEEWKDDLSTKSLITLTNDEEAIAEQYRKMQKMGLPDDAVRHRMELNEVDTKIIAHIFGEKSEMHSQPSPSGMLSAEEEAIATQYRKMQHMGLPDDAVRHKMIVSEVDPKIIAAVFREQSNVEPDANSGTATGVWNTEPNAIAYVVVVGDKPIGESACAGSSDYNSVISLNPDEKFAVKVADEANPHSPTKKMKFFTLDELAKISGQNKSELEAIVTDKKRRGASPPRFSLQPLDEKKYEVTMPTQSNLTQQSNFSRLTSKHTSEIKAGQEVVDSELAKAARAVSALGDGDMSTLLEKLKAGDMKDLLAKLLEAEKRQKKLEKQLAQAGVAIAEDIEYQEAKGKVEEIAKRMNEIGGSDVTVADKEEQNRLREEYFKLEQEMERYNTALVLSEEYQAEQDRLERKWEADNEPANIEALKKLRRHMPVNIRHLSEADLTTKPSPNGKYLSSAIAKKFKRTNILQCLRLNPDDLECMHPATLENMRVTGLTLTERRALYIHFKPIGPKWEKNKAEKMTERKWVWYQMMKNNFKENVAPYQRHVDQYGPPENHTCPLIGKQCPIKADKVMDYDEDYGWTEAAEFELSDVRKADVEDSGAKAMAEALNFAKEKKANERADLLKKHYKGKLLQVSKANGSCESMDESMDQMENNAIRWIENILNKGDSSAEADKKKEVANFTDALNEFKLKLLNFAQRSGMQMSGKKTAGGDSPDIRSSVEASLAEEVFECSMEFFAFIRNRMKQLAIMDTRATKTIEMLEGILNELHDRNLILFEALGAKRMTRSRKLRSMSDLKKEAEDKRKASENAASPDAEADSPMRPPPAAAGGRGGLMDAIAGRGRGRGGGRGGLMDAISGRGGRGGLLDAIAGRGAKTGRGGDGGGRGGLLYAIAARGAGRGRGGGEDGDRGGLLAAIAARGGGG